MEPMTPNTVFLFVLDETDKFPTARDNAVLVLKYATAYPFRIRGRFMVCVFCLREYDDPVKYREHMDLKHQRFKTASATYHCAATEYVKADCTNLRCRDCHVPLGSLSDTAKHIHEAHDKKFKIDGDIGLQIFDFQKDKWNCVICKEKFPNLVKLNRHVTTHYQNSTCDLCGKCYLSKNSLNAHIKFSHTEDQICRKCKARFPDVKSKKEHLKGSKRCWPFCCVRCGERFISWEYKMRHLDKVHGVARPSYDCPECDASYKTRKHFYDHYSKTHAPDSSLACGVCGKQFSCRKNMENHVVIHTGLKPFECQYCAKCFNRKSTLTQHLWIHSEEKRFVCSMCDKKFSQRVSYDGHMRRYHPDVQLNCELK